MVKKLVTKIVLWGIVYLKKRKTDLFEPSTKEKQVAKLSAELIKLQSEVSVLRFNIIQVYNAFYNSIEGSFLSQLAKEKDSSIKTTATQSWFEVQTSLVNMYKKHEELISQFDAVADELNKINELNNTQVI